MHAFSVDYRKRDGRQRGTLVNRGFWLHDIPRLLLTCRTLGHVPVVDGTGSGDQPGSAYRWVCCDRCGIRPEGQGSLDPAVWNVGDRYTGDWADAPPPKWTPKTLTDVDPDKRRRLAFTSPGPWPKSPTWVFGGQGILGKSFGGVSAEVKIGNCGSEHTLAAHLRISPIGALYLHTERLGTWLQRRLNPTGYESRVTGFTIGHGSLNWKLWSKRDSWSKGDPRWQQGSIRIDPRDHVLGVRRYWHTNEGDPVVMLVRLPHGDDHDVTLQLQRQEHGRVKSKRRKQTWCVDWDRRGGIPTKPGDRGRIMGAGVDVSDAAVRKGTWPLEAAAAIAKQITAMRTREGMGAPEAAKTDA